MRDAGSGLSLKQGLSWKTASCSNQCEAHRKVDISRRGCVKRWHGQALRSARAFKCGLAATTRRRRRGEQHHRRAEHPEAPVALPVSLPLALSDPASRSPEMAPRRSNTSSVAMASRAISRQTTVTGSSPGVAVGDKALGGTPALSAHATRRSIGGGRPDGRGGGPTGDRLGGEAFLGGALTGYSTCVAGRATPPSGASHTSVVSDDVVTPTPSRHDLGGCQLRGRAWRRGAAGPKLGAVVVRGCRPDLRRRSVGTDYHPHTRAHHYRRIPSNPPARPHAHTPCARTQWRAIAAWSRRRGGSKCRRR